MGSIQFADTESARKIVGKLYPIFSDVHVVDLGSENTIYIVDKKFVVRFPQDKGAYMRSMYEKYILPQLKNTKGIDTPHLLDENNGDPPYIVTSFVSGKHLSADEVRSLPEEKQNYFAKKLARFTYSMHTSFDIDKELMMRKDLELDKPGTSKPWSASFKDNIFDYTLPDEKQNKIAKKYYADWLARCDTRPTVVVHNDLLQDNMMFDDGNNLSGVIDFGDVNVGVPEQEFQQLYRVGEDLIKIAAQEYYRLSGVNLDLEAIKTWAITRELSDYCKRIATNETDHPKFRNACTYLNTWLPEITWGVYSKTLE